MAPVPRQLPLGLVGTGLAALLLWVGPVHAASSAPVRAAPASPLQEPRRPQSPLETAVLTAQAFAVDARLEIEPLADRAATRDALASGLEAIRRAEILLATGPSPLGHAEPSVEGLAELNRQAGISTVTVDPSLFELLRRTLDFCEFSNGAFGPLGGQLIRLWGLRQPVVGRPGLAALSQASSAASCNRLILHPEDHTAALAAGTVADLLALERAFAVDRAVAALRERGATSGWVQIGYVARAFGGGPDGAGWPIAVDVTDPVTTPTERVLLNDRALALAAAWIDPIEIAGDREAPHLDQRTGRPAEGTVAVLTVTETAVDAAGLAAALFVMPQRIGRYRLGPLRPQPAVKWFLGAGDGAPLVAESRWAELPKWRPPRSPLDR